MRSAPFSSVSTRIRRAGSIVSSNTSGLSIARLAEGRSDDFRSHWLGTHFFNPPRYLPLLEVIPTADTDPAVIAAVRDFADRRLGKNVVVAKDTPGFIANHVAMHGLVRIFEALAEGTYTVEEIDAITGAAIGRPKSATFRTVDIAGLDILVHVADDLAARLPHGRRSQFQFPPFVHEMLTRGWIGEKAGRGFYERRRNDAGETDIWALDPQNNGVSAQAAGQAAVARCRRTAPAARADAEALFGNRSRRGVSPIHASRLPCDTSQRSHRRSRIRSTTSIARCDGGTGGRSARSSWLTRSGSSDKPYRTSPLRPAGPELEILRSARDRAQGGCVECRRQPHRSRRRRARRLAPLEDERDRRRRAGYAPAGRPRGVREFCGARRRGRRTEFLRRRQPDAAAARSAGRQLGRYRRDDSIVPEDDHGPSLLRSACRRRAVRADARRRLRSRACTAIACRPPPKATSVWWKSASG